MAPYLPPPDHSTLLPPLLACLPAAFASPRPPPALLPLLSPILRQRVNLLSQTSEPKDGSWLPLLCWETSEASKIASLIESGSFEPHPVSGEIELEEVTTPVFRRLDEETLQSAFELPDLGLRVVYVWCENDAEGGLPGWRLSELRPRSKDSKDASRPWSETIGNANGNFKDSSMAQIPLLAPESSTRQPAPAPAETAENQDEDDDDDYWAQYDNTPARTPAPKRSPAPNGASTNTTHARSTSEAAYFEQYADVQPEMDNDDPDADREEIGHSSLNGNQITGLQTHFSSTEAYEATKSSAANDLVHTRPSSSSSSAVVANLESSVQSQPLAEVAVHQHISTTMKSLFRLAKGAGIERAEFESLVARELEVLGMLEDE